MTVFVLIAIACALFWIAVGLALAGAWSDAGWLALSSCSTFAVALFLGLMKVGRP